MEQTKKELQTEMERMKIIRDNKYLEYKLAHQMYKFSEAMFESKEVK